jgi:hypothetical protein
MHDDRKHDQHVPPSDPPREKDGRIFKPLHVILGAVMLVAILVIYMVMIAKQGY